MYVIERNAQCIFTQVNRTSLWGSYIWGAFTNKEGTMLLFRGSCACVDHLTKLG